MLHYMFVGFLVKAQTPHSWHKINVPLYSDFKKIQFISQDTAFISGKQLLLYDGHSFKAFEPKPPIDINIAFAVNSHCIYIADNTAYQNSILYRWDGKEWKALDHPMANNIQDMYFTDPLNGVLVGYGEIIRMVNGEWETLTPPNNRSLSQCIPVHNGIMVLSHNKGIFVYSKEWKPIKNSFFTQHINHIHHTIYAWGNDFLGIIKNDSLIKISNDAIWNRINTLTQTPDSTLIGVGINGLMIQFRDGKITPFKNSFTQTWNDMAYHNGLWCVGDEGSILTDIETPNQNTESLWKGFKQLTFNSTAKIIDDEYGVIAADFDNDGWTDIFTCGLFEQEHLYMNHKNMVFVEKKHALRQSGNPNDDFKELNLGACAGDLDNDGYTDLYLCTLNGKNKIYKNINGKYFVDYSVNTGGTGKSDDRTNAAIMGDIDNDGDLDIFITNEYSTNRLFINNGAGIFKEITHKAGLESIEGGNSATFGDIDNDGDIDLYVTNWSSENKLYQNQYAQTGKIRFIDITQSSHTGGLAYAKSNAAVFSDLDNDGDLDLFVSNRKLSNKLYINTKNGIFIDKTESLIGRDSDTSYGVVIADFDGDSYKDIYVSNVGKNRFYKNNKGFFTDQTSQYGALIKGYSTGSATADFDQDGDIDLYIANYVGSGSTLLQNIGNNPNSIIINVAGNANNTRAIGTKIYVYATDNNQEKLLWFDEIRTGTGYVSENDFQKIIPIQDFKKVQIKLIFPNGISKEYKNISAGSHLYIHDLSGFSQLIARVKHAIFRNFYDPLELYGLIKWIFVLLMVTIFGFMLQKKHLWKPVYPLIGGFALLVFYYIQYKTFKYDSFLYATVLPLSGVIGIILLTYYFFEQYYVRKLNVIEKNKIRQKLSRDLHDDLAATISSIGFYLTLIRFGLKEKNTKVLAAVQKSEDLIEDATGALTDLIWSINPKPESIQNLLLRLQQKFDLLFKDHAISFTIHKDKELAHYQLSGNTKQNIFLILKEAINNSIKYAAPTQIDLKLYKTAHKIAITISDNGRGFVYTDAIERGNGLTNMQTRAAEIQAEINIKTAEGQGTSIRILFDIPSTYKSGKK